MRRDWRRRCGAWADRSAFVVLKAGIVGDNLRIKILQDHVKAIIAPYKYPRVIKFIDALPKTQTGKINVSSCESRHHDQKLI